MIFIGFTACKKGDTGLQGIQGEQGVAGLDGSTVLSGRGAPSSDVGVAGDFYIDIANGALYGPKAANGWDGNPINLIGADGADGAKGATGAAGKNGNTILSGSGAPAASLGNAGDYYFDKTNSSLYGPKTASGWGGGLQLQGKDGNANVKTRTFASIAWSASSTSAGYDAYVSLSVPEITQDIQSNGAVIVYLSTNGIVSPNWQAAPLTELFNGALRYTISSTIFSDHVEIDTWFGNSADFTGFYKGAAVKVVVIQGSAATSNINLKDYNAVKKAFNIGD